MDGQHRDGAAASVESETTVRRSFVGMVRGGDVRLEQAGAGLVLAGGGLSIENGGCGPVVANGGVTIHNGGCGPLIANGDASIENGGTQLILAAGEARVGRNAFVGVVASPKVTVEDGARVLAGSPISLAIGAVAGFALGALARGGRRRRKARSGRRSARA